MGEDACSYCNSRNPSIKCFVAAWNPPNPLTGEYPHLGPDGEEETILHRGCLTCTVMGKTCSKLGQQLYPLDGIKVSRTCFTRDFYPRDVRGGPSAMWRRGDDGELMVRNISSMGSRWSRSESKRYIRSRVSSLSLSHPHTVWVHSLG